METVVQVGQGQLRGSVENGLHIFKGVPYAAPIDGTNRFRAPQPRESQAANGATGDSRSAVVAPKT